MLKRYKIVAGILAVTLMIGGVLVYSNLQAKAEEINDTNPELTFHMIDSDLEQTFYGYTVHKQTGKMDVNTANAQYEISTDSMAAWQATDDVAFAYKLYNIGATDEDRVEVHVTIPKIATGTSVHHNATYGIMLRTGLEPEAANVFLGYRSSGMTLTYRSNTGDMTGKQQPTVGAISFPLTLRVTKEGSTVYLSYKGADDPYFKDFPYPVGLKGDGPLYVGIAAHSHNPDVTNTMYFNDFKVNGTGTYTPGESGGSTPEEKPEEVLPDSAQTENLLMRETFSDGDLYNVADTGVKDKRDYPVWTRTLSNKPVIRNLDGNRVWDLSGEHLYNYFGDTYLETGREDGWTDYKVSVDLFYTEEANPELPNAFSLYVRHTDVDFYGNADYHVTIRNGYELTLSKNQYIDNDGDDMTDPTLLTKVSDGVTPLTSVNLKDVLKDDAYCCLTDGKWHTLAMSVVDNVIKVYWDEMTAPVIDFTDTVDETGIAYGDQTPGKRVYTNGKVGVSVNEASLYIDNIVVTAIEDTFGGDYDNVIGGNWNENMPDYVKDIIDNYGKKFTYY